MGKVAAFGHVRSWMFLTCISVFQLGGDVFVLILANNYR